MGQRFFVFNRRYESLDEKGDPLVAIAAMVLWESFQLKLKAAPIKGALRRREAARKNLAGRKPWHEIAVFKGLALQAFDNLSGDRTEYQGAIASRSCGFSALVSKTRLPAPKLCSSSARHWPRRARRKSRSICS